MYFHIERSGDLLLALHCPSNLPLWKRYGQALCCMAAHIFKRGIVTDVRYTDAILEPFARPFRDAVSNDFILMDDNAGPHNAHHVDDFLENEDID